MRVIKKILKHARYIVGGEKRQWWGPWQMAQQTGWRVCRIKEIAAPRLSAIAVMWKFGIQEQMKTGICVIGHIL